MAKKIDFKKKNGKVKDFYKMLVLKSTIFINCKMNQHMK